MRMGPEQEIFVVLGLLISFDSLHIIDFAVRV